MPINFRYQGVLVWVELVGEYSIEDLKSSFLVEIKKLDYPLHARLLFDVTSTRAYEKASPEEMQDLADFFSSFAGKFIDKCAVLVSSANQFEVSKIVSIYSKVAGLEAKAFIDVGEAMAWLSKPVESGGGTWNAQ